MVTHPVLCRLQELKGRVVDNPAMKEINQRDCFSINLKFLYYLGIWPNKSLNTKSYYVYSIFFIFVFVVLYDILLSINLFYMPKILDNYIEEMVFYFTELSVLSKVLTFYFMRAKLETIFTKLGSPCFQPRSDKELETIKCAWKFNKKYWKILTAVSIISHVTHTIIPVFAHILGFGDLKLVICSYSFIEDEVKKRYIYPIYIYQTIGMHFHMWYNVNIDSLFLDLLTLTTAQLKNLHEKLRTITDEQHFKNSTNKNDPAFEFNDIELILKLNESVNHFDEVARFSSLIQDVFTITLFLQFGMASSIICICLFRFTMRAVWQYYVFLATYLFIMVIQIFVPCWLGTQITEKSFKLSEAIYNCDWTSRSKKFKSGLQIFVVRMNRPLKLTGWNMFPLSLTTFTSIVNAAFSFFTLLQHMQSIQ